MRWYILANIFKVFLTLFRLGFHSDQEKDLEILLLRHQLNILERKRNQIVRAHRIDRMLLSVLADRLKLISGRSASKLSDIIRIFQPETVLRWQSFPRTIGDRELVRRKWTSPHKHKGDRSPIDQELEKLILRLANENPRWGYGKIEGEMLKAERWVRTVREECLDHILILNGTHLRSVLHEYVEGYYNAARPHQGIGQGIPLPRRQPVGSGAVQKRQLLGGVINDYCRAPVRSSRYIN